MCATVEPASAGTAGQEMPVKSGWERSTSMDRHILKTEKGLLHKFMMM